MIELPKIAPVDIWHGLHDFLVLPRCKPVSTTYATSGRIVGHTMMVDGRLVTYTDQFRVQFPTEASEAVIEPYLSALARSIADCGAVAFAHLPIPRDPGMLIARLQSPHSPVKLRVLIGSIGMYPVEPFYPFQRVTRLDVLVARGLVSGRKAA